MEFTCGASKYVVTGSLLGAVGVQTAMTKTSQVFFTVTSAPGAKQGLRNLEGQEEDVLAAAIDGAPPVEFIVETSYLATGELLELKQ